MKVQAVVVAHGARTSVGLDALSTAMCQHAHAVGMKASPILDAAGEGATICFVPTLDPLESGDVRAVSLGVPALDEALRRLGPGVRELRAKFVACVDEYLAARKDGSGSSASYVVGELHRRCRELVPQTQLEVSARGAASLGYALEAGLEALGRGTVELLVIGGAHTDYEVARIRELSEQDRLLKADGRTGLLAGEAAGFVVLARPDVARMMRLSPLCNVHLATTGWEKARPDNDEPAFEATGMTAAVRKVAATLEEHRAKVGWVLTDLTFEPWRVNELQAVLARTARHFCEPMHVESPAQRLGSMGAATQAVHLVIAAEGFRSGFAPHPIALSIAGSETGERAAVLVSAA